MKFVGFSGSRKPPVLAFFAASIVFFFLILSVFDSLGFVPCIIDGTCKTVAQQNSQNAQNAQTQPSAQQQAPAPVVGVAPDHIKIAAIDLDLPVQNPDTRDLDTLDTLLQQGPARFVDSAKLGENGNMIIFAHSSHLPIVHNQMFRAFNNIPDLKAGDTITLSGGGKDYLYSVVDVKKAEATDDYKIYINTDHAQLTLVTCDTLTGKSARFVLTANYVGSVAQ